MGFTGRGFVGFIGYAPSVPTVHDCVKIKLAAGGATATVSLTAPAGVSVGDVIVASVGAGSYINGDPWTFTPDAAWTPIYVTDLSARTVLTNLYTKIATAADVTQSVSYTWSITVTGGLAGITVIHTSWPQRFGTVLSSPAMTESRTPSLASPGGDFQFSFIYERSASNFAQPAPNPVVTSDATLLCEHITAGSDSYRAGQMRVYASSRVSPITGDYLTGGIDFPQQGLVVAAVT